LKNGLINDADFKKLDDECREICEEAVRFAEESSFPPPEELYSDIFA